MARRDALLRLHTSLVARRDELRKRLGGELNNLFDKSNSGDSADQAFDSGREEVNSQLAELESREVAQIDRSLQRLKQGTYGQCEACTKKIPVARLNALPYTTLCIECQREIETYGRNSSNPRIANWDQLADARPLEDQREVNLSEIELDMSR